MNFIMKVMKDIGAKANMTLIIKSLILKIQRDIGAKTSMTLTARKFIMKNFSTPNIMTDTNPNNSISILKNLLNAGAGFASFTYKSKGDGSIARYTLNLGFKYITLLEKSIQELQTKIDLNEFSFPTYVRSITLSDPNSYTSLKINAPINFMIFENGELYYQDKTIISMDEYLNSIVTGKPLISSPGFKRCN